MRRESVQAAALTIALVLAAGPAAAQHWRQFRGDDGNGAAPAEAALPLVWSADEHVVWKTPIPGVGWSQPVVWGSRIFLTTAIAEDQPKPDPANMGPGVGGFAGFFASAGGTNFKPPETDYQWKVLCLDAATGDVLWEKTARQGRPTIHIHGNNTYATETPATDGERLVACFGMTGVFCYDLDGELLWEKELDAFPMQFGWGTGSSPVIDDKHVYLQCDNDQSSSLVALDKRTGDQAWRVERDELSNWSTPYLWKNKLRTELVVAGGKQMRSYDPATGKLLWQLRAEGRTAATPVGDDERLIVDSYQRLTGASGVMAAVLPGGEGDITPAGKATSGDFVAWTARVPGYRMASPALAGGCIVVVEQGGGIVHCLDAATGKEHYRKRAPDAGGFSASPLAAAGRVYCLDQRGRTTVLEPGAELNVLASNDLGEMSWASPAIAGDRLLIRTLDHLWCIGE
jgi:outer membrane protein assembly factor BamB